MILWKRNRTWLQIIFETVPMSSDQKMESQERHSEFQDVIQHSSPISVLKKLQDVILQYLKSPVLLLHFSMSQQWCFRLPLPENEKEISNANEKEISLENKWETCLTEKTIAQNLSLISNERYF